LRCVHPSSARAGLRDGEDPTQRRKPSNRLNWLCSCKKDKVEWAMHRRGLTCKLRSPWRRDVGTGPGERPAKATRLVPRQQPRRRGYWSNASAGPASHAAVDDRDGGGRPGHHKPPRLRLRARGCCGHRSRARQVARRRRSGTCRRLLPHESLSPGRNSPLATFPISVALT